MIKSKLLKLANFFVFILSLINLLIFLSLRNAVSIWEDLTTDKNFCDVQYCDFFNIFTSEVVFFFSVAVLIGMLIKEWFVKPVIQRLTINGGVFIFSSLLLVIFFIGFYRPILSASTI